MHKTLAECIHGLKSCFSLDFLFLSVYFFSFSFLNPEGGSLTATLVVVVVISCLKNA